MSTDLDCFISWAPSLSPGSTPDSSFANVASQVLPKVLIRPNTHGNRSKRRGTQGTHCGSWKTLWSWQWHGLTQVFWYSCCKARDLCEWKNTHYRSQMVIAGAWQPGWVDPHGIQDEAFRPAWHTDLSIAHTWCNSSLFKVLSQPHPNPEGWERTQPLVQLSSLSSRRPLHWHHTTDCSLSPSFHRWANKHNVQMGCLWEELSWMDLF